MPAGFSMQDFQYILPEIVLTAGASLTVPVGVAGIRPVINRLWPPP